MRTSLACALLCAATLQPLAGQQPDDPWSLDILAMEYSTGDDVNCPVGYGLGLDVERRPAGPLSFGGSIGVRAAGPLACTLVGAGRVVGGRALVEYDQLIFYPGPVVAVSMGVLGRRTSRVMLSVRGGAARGTFREPRKLHPIMAFAQGELVVRGASLGGVLRLGAVRAPIYLGQYVNDVWHTVLTQWRLRWWLEAGVELF